MFTVHIHIIIILIIIIIIINQHDRKLFSFVVIPGEMIKLLFELQTTTKHSKTYNTKLILGRP